jgi:hypothetical protein
LPLEAGCSLIVWVDSLVSVTKEHRRSSKGIVLCCRSVIERKYVTTQSQYA